MKISNDTFVSKYLKKCLNNIFISNKNQTIIINFELTLMIIVSILVNKILNDNLEHKCDVIVDIKKKYFSFFLMKQREIQPIPSTIMSKCLSHSYCCMQNIK